MPKPAPQAAAALARGIVHFNAGRYRPAEAAFRAAAAAGAEQASFFLEQARQALRDDPAGFDRDAAAFRAEARAGRPAAMAAAAKKLEARSPVRAFRVYRDVWLTGKIPAAPFGRSSWSAYLRSSRLWRRGRNAEAVRESETAAAAKGFAWQGYQSAEILLRRLGDAEGALDALARTRVGAPWLWEAACLEAEIRAGRGELDALAPLEGLTPPPGSETAFFSWRGALKLWTRGGAEALADLERGAGTPDGLGWRGAAKAHAGDLEGALTDLNERLQSEADPEALCWRGEVRERLGDRAGALADYAAALAVSPGWFWARVGRESCDPATPAPVREAHRAARIAARGLRRPDAHLQGFRDASGAFSSTRPRGPRRPA